MLFALGTLGGTILFHLIPEYIENQENYLFLLLSFPSFFVWFIPNFFKGKKNAASNQQSIVALIAGDSLHNATTSVLWLSLCLASGNVEYMIIPAILVHEIPHKVANFGIMIFSGLSKKMALMMSIFATLFFFSGLLLYQLPFSIDGKLFIPIIIGSLSYTLYAGLQHEKSYLTKPGNIFWLAGGVFLMIFVNFLTEGLH